MGVMTEQETLSIEHACRRLILDFAFYSDRREYETLAALFTVQGTLTRPSGEVLVGQDAIVASYRGKASTRITRHICTNIRITVESSQRARGLTYAIVFGADSHQKPVEHFGIRADARQLVGEFEDLFAMTSEGWRFESRIARFTMFTG
jgi:hypothetical protein